MPQPATTRPRIAPDRREVLGMLSAALTGLAAAPLVRQQGGDPIPASGAADPNLAPFDRLMLSFVKDNRVPGAALAVTRNGKLVYARGFGHADAAKKEPVQPDALFRIASVSKPITAVAILRLVEAGKIALDDPVFERMKLEPPDYSGARFDPRWKRVTIRQCLQHTGGWDRGVSFDPITRPWVIATLLGVKPPVTPTHVIRYALGQPLDFDPGKRVAYSNLGYLVLGQIIEVVTGKKYEGYVKKEVFAPLKITAPRLGRALARDRAKGEVCYHVARNPRGPAVYPPQLGEEVPVQYGAHNLEGYAAHGGWIASAVDLVKFASAFDDPANCPILGKKLIEQMWARPEGVAGFERDNKTRPAYYACGWDVRPMGKEGKSNTWHTGYIAGSEALLVRRHDGFNWAVLFNTNNNHRGQSLSGLIDGQLHAPPDQVKKWPQADLFARYFR